MSTDFGIIIKRDDDSYVIDANGLPYHVPNMEGFYDLYAEVDAYASANPDKVTPEVVAAPSLPEKADEARRKLQDALLFHQYKPVPFEFPVGSLETNGQVNTGIEKYFYPATEEDRNKLETNVRSLLKTALEMGKENFEAAIPNSPVIWLDAETPIVKWFVDAKKTVVFTLTVVEQLFHKILFVDAECYSNWQTYANQIESCVAGGGTDAGKIRFLQSLIDSNFPSGWPE